MNEICKELAEEFATVGINWLECHNTDLEDKELAALKAVVAKTVEKELRKFYADNGSGICR